MSPCTRAVPLRCWSCSRSHTATPRHLAPRRAGPAATPPAGKFPLVSSVASVSWVMPRAQGGVAGAGFVFCGGEALFPSPFLSPPPSRHPPALFFGRFRLGGDPARGGRGGGGGLRFGRGGGLLPGDLRLLG